MLLGEHKKLEKEESQAGTALIKLQLQSCNGIIFFFVLLPSIPNANSDPQKSNIY